MNIRKILHTIDEAIFPSNIYCLVCGCMIDVTRPYSLCDKCVREIHWITGGICEDGEKQNLCSKCGKALDSKYQGQMCYDCMSRRHYFTKGWSCMTYGLHEREILMNIKYHEKGYMAVKMGDVLYDRMALIVGDVHNVNLNIDIVIPTPVSAKRLRKRGYNQSALMAQRFVKRCYDGGMTPEYDEKILIRVRETETLRNLNPTERTMALKGAFAVKKGTECRIKQKSILLIDDIYTTGATADACSRSLLKAGAKHVYLLTLASGSNRRPSELGEDRFVNKD